MKLALFFTRGISLKSWLDMGLFSREKLVYEEHLRQGILDKVFWFTYGPNDTELSRKLKQDGLLHQGIEVVGLPSNFRGYAGIQAYSFALPVLQKRKLSQVDILKTNQMDGSWGAVMAKWLYGKKLFVRTGFTWSIFALRKGWSAAKIRTIHLVERLAYRYADAATVTAREDARYIKSRYQIHPDKVTVMPNYVDTTLFKPSSGRKRHDRLIFVGRLAPQKICRT